LSEPTPLFYSQKDYKKAEIIDRIAVLENFLIILIKE